MLTSKDIEEIAVDSVKKIVRKSKILEAYIGENDKKPSYDGEIFMYKQNKSLGKSDFKNKIDVQVKGKEVKSFSKETAKYDMEVNDLKAYYNSRGVILFLVEIIDNDNAKIFYNKLLPVDLKAELNRLKRKNQKKRRIDCKELKCDVIELEDIIKTFDRNISNQPQYLVDKEIRFEDLNKDYKLTIDFPKSLKDVSFEEDYYIYGKLNKFDIKIPLIQKLKVEKIYSDVEADILAGDKVHYKTFKRVRSKNGFQIEIGDRLLLNLDTGKFLVQKPQGTVESYLKMLYFLRDIVKYKYIYIDDEKIEFDDLLGLDYIDERAVQVDEIQKTFLDLGIDQSRFLFKEIDDESFETLVEFTNSLMNEKSISFKKKIKQMSIIKLKVEKLILVVLVVPVDRNKYKVVNIFDGEQKFSFETNNKTMKISPYLMVDQSYMSCDNFSFERAKKDITSYEASKEYIDIVNSYILKLLNSFDNNKEYKYIDLASYLMNWLHENSRSEDVYITINKHQITKRSRSLNIHEIAELIDIKNSNKDNQVQCAINILLDNIKEAAVILKDMTSKEKEVFKGYPIYTLLKDKT
ncbi:MAG: DUF4365 domain-containing protein [Clostridioides difficile]|nr:DUF4365 domain-containing protein [Clostridioides difficile]